MDDPHARARGLIAEIGGIRQIGSVFTFAETAPVPAPQQGQHTRVVLREIGMNDVEIGELEAAEVIKTVGG